MAPSVITLDLDFMGRPGSIAAYLIPHHNGAVLVECGPGSTISALQAGLKTHGYTPADITDCFLTHIHLDHAGAAGWLARQGVRIHVHPNGAPHLLNPGKLLISAQRIYGENMDVLWGEFLPVPQDSLAVMQDNEVAEIGEVQIRAIDTPGHAEHHLAYIYEDVCFSGDIGGVRLTGLNHIRLPMPPPELNLEKWRMSQARLQNEKFTRIAPTHFGIFNDAPGHLARLGKSLDEIERWVESVMPSDPPIDDLNTMFIDWSRQRSIADDVLPAQIETYETANPSWMSTTGIQRYWRKHRMPAANEQ